MLYCNHIELFSTILHVLNSDILTMTYAGCCRQLNDHIYNHWEQPHQNHTQTDPTICVHTPQKKQQQYNRGIYGWVVKVSWIVITSHSSYHHTHHFMKKGMSLVGWFMFFLPSPEHVQIFKVLLYWFITNNSYQSNRKF